MRKSLNAGWQWIKRKGGYDTEVDDTRLDNADMDSSLSSEDIYSPCEDNIVERGTDAQTSASKTQRYTTDVRDRKGDTVNTSVIRFGPPGDFTATRDANGMVHFTWAKPDDVNDGSCIDYYTIMVSNYFKCDIPQDKPYKYNGTMDNMYAESIQLESELSYDFEITAHSNDFTSESRKQRLLLAKHYFLTKSAKLEGSLIPTYLIPTRDTSKQIIRKEIGHPPQSGVVKDEKIILVVGATGSGKTTWINAILNYILGVKYTDNFRYKMVVDKGASNQASSQTQDVTIYTIHHQEGYLIDYTLTIIDTPGFGDTRGIVRDKEIEKLFKSAFNTEIGGVDHLDAVGFMACSSSARLSQTQKYIFTSILSLFGVDIKENIFMLFTFADGHVPQVLHAVKAAELPFEEYFKFNNSAIFIDTDQEAGTDDDGLGDFNRMFWNLGMKSFMKFLQKVYVTKTKSLTLTKGVLDERERIQLHVTNLHAQVKKGLSYMEQLRDEVRILETANKDIDSSKDYTYKVKKFEMNKKPLPHNQNTTTCLQCNYTCHENCAFANDSEKANCVAMDTEGNCMECKGKCRWDMHRNLPYIYEEKEIFVTCTKDEIKGRYEKACGQKLTTEQTVQKIEEELKATETQIKAALSEITCSLKRLNEIALKHDPKTQVDYIDLLVETERTEAKPGWQGRIIGLNDLRQQAQDIYDINQGVYDPFKDYRESAEEERKKGSDMSKSSTWLGICNTFEWLAKPLKNFSGKATKPKRK